MREQIIPSQKFGKRRQFPRFEGETGRRVSQLPSEKLSALKRLKVVHSPFGSKAKKCPARSMTN